MKKPPKAKAPLLVRRPASGLTGGPSTIRGVTYQVDHAVYLLLDQISLSLADPFTPRSITVEPRTIKPKVVRWDISTYPPETTFEAKFNPKREELVDWLKLVRQASAGAPERRFRFVYAEERAAARLIHTVKALSRIATEVNGNRAAFDGLVVQEEVSGANELLTLLGEYAVKLLQMIDLDQLSTSAIDKDIDLRLRYLVPPEQSANLRKYLFEKLQRLAPSRVSISVGSVIDELRQAGFSFYQPQQIDVGGLSSHAFAALSVMENCRSGLPVEVLVAVTGLNSDELAVELQPISQAFTDGQLWSLAPLGARLSHPNEAELRARALEELLTFVKRHGKSALAQAQVMNVVSLAEACLSTHPRLVARVFGDVDKMLKETGQKHLVRDVADLSKNAALRSTASDRDIKLAIVRSLICGLAWYYQRVGELEEANVAASKSLRFAREVNSKEDLAFSAKCTGRLRRLEAEEMAPADRQAKISESVGMLERAINYFTEAERHGPNSPEVGDCYSLLARTYLVAGEIATARDRLHRALARIPDDGGKDLIDALILDGDIEAADGNESEALLRYDKSVAKAQSPGREVTEMRARALRQRGRIKRVLGDVAGAEVDLNEAARIWSELGEPNFAAEVEFELLDLAVKLSDVSLSILKKESAIIRLQAMKLHVAKVEERGQSSKRVVGRRVEPPPNYWKELIKNARELVGFEGV
jgi:tetratricopeptide (TPR) repeat protein